MNIKTKGKKMVNYNTYEEVQLDRRKSIIRHIKKHRLSSPEKELIKLLGNVVEIKLELFSDSIFYKYKNKIMFEMETLNKTFYINYNEFLKKIGDTIFKEDRKLLSNLELVLNEHFELSQYNIEFSTDIHRSFWNMI